MSEVVLSFSNVSKQYGDLRAVHDATFQIRHGEIIGFVGPNGAGKSTTIAMMLGFINTSSGTVSILDRHPITSANAHKTHQSIGYVAGDMSLFDDLKPEQYLRFFAHRNGCDKDYVKDLMGRLKPKLDGTIKQLSRGNKQKIALIAALQHKPSLLILDEPTSGLDPLMQEIFLDITQQAAQRGTTVFMSSHILSEVASACTRVIFMKNGKIVTDKPIEEIEKSSGKVVRLTAAPAIVKQAAHYLPGGAKILVTTATALEFSYKGDAQQLLRWLGSRKIDDVTIEEISLDDVFRHMYQEKEL